MSRRSAWIPALLLVGAIAGCRVPPGPPGGPVLYTITGTISLTSDCNRPVSPLPVTIKANLSNAAGTIKIGGAANVNLVGAPPAALTAPYTITVNAAAMAPSDWTDFDIVDATGNPPCKALGCAVAGRTCSNIAQWPRKSAAVAPPGATTENFSIMCACGT